MLLAKKRLTDSDQDEITPKRSVRFFSEGLVSQLSNPKAIMFFRVIVTWDLGFAGGN